MSAGKWFPGKILSFPVNPQLSIALRWAGVSNLDDIGSRGKSHGLGGLIHSTENILIIERQVGLSRPTQIKLKALASFDHQFGLHHAPERARVRKDTGSLVLGNIKRHFWLMALIAVRSLFKGDQDLTVERIDPRSRAHGNPQKTATQTPSSRPS